jgi:hypothetical protein
MSSSIQLNLSESLRGVLSYNKLTDRTYIDSDREWEIMIVELKLNYSCNKLMAKCYEDFIIRPDLQFLGKVSVYIKLEVMESDGKLSTECKDGLRVRVGVDRGKGVGNIRLVYKLVARPLGVGTFSCDLTLFTESEKGISTRLVGPISIVVEALKAFDLLDINVNPENPEYFPGDELSVSLKYYSNYDGLALLRVGGAVDEMSEKLELKRGSGGEWSKVLTIRNFNKKYLSVVIEIPELNVKMIKNIDMNITPQKINMELIEVSDEAVIGKHIRLRIKVVNKSSLSGSLIRLNIKVYEHYIRSEVRLDPGGFKLIEFTTPLITYKSLNDVSGYIELTDLTSGHVILQELKLEKPKPPVYLNLSKSHVIYSSAKRYESEIILSNNLDSEISVIMAMEKTPICDVSLQQSTVTLGPLAEERVAVLFTPRSIGNDKLRLSLKVEVERSLIYEYSEELLVEIRPAFNVLDVSVLNIRNNNVIKGQELTIRLHFKVLCDELVELNISGKNLEVRGSTSIMIPPEEVLVSAVTVGYGEPTITLNDGLYSVEVKVPIVIVKPDLSVEQEVKVIYGGIKNAVFFKVNNPYDTELKLTVGVDEPKDFIKVLTKSREIFLRPHSSMRFDMEFVGLRRTDNLTLNLKFKVSTEAEEYVFVKTFDFIVEDPVELEVVGGSRNIFIPTVNQYSSVLQELNIPIHMKISVKNSVKQFIDDVRIILMYREAGNKVLYDKNQSLRPDGLTEHLHTSVPYNILTDVITVLYRVIVSGYYVMDGELTEIQSIRYTPIVVELSKFNSEECPYPYVKSGDSTYLLIPIKAVPEVCGDLTKLSLLHKELVESLYDIALKYVEKTPESIWDIISSVVFGQSIYMKSQFSTKLKSYEDIVFRVKGIDILPAILWRTTLAKLASHKLEHPQVNFNKVGILVPSSEKRFHTIRNEFYINLLNLVFYGDDGSKLWLRSHIENNVRNLCIDPLYLIYILNGGEHIKYDKDIVDRLARGKRFSDLLIYLALADQGAWLFNEELVEGTRKVLIENSQAVLSRNSSKVALSIILSRVITLLYKRIFG